MKVVRNSQKIKAIVWDHEGVLVLADWCRTYDLAFRNLGIKPAFEGDPLRGEIFRNMLRVPHSDAITDSLETFVTGQAEDDYLASYSCSNIGSQEYWTIALEHGFKLKPSVENITAVRTALMFNLIKPHGGIRIVPQVIKIMKEIDNYLPQFLLCNTNPEVYQTFKDQDYMLIIPPKNRFVSIHQQCRKPSDKSFKSLVSKTAYMAHELLFIDDKLANVAAAQRNGFNAFQFNSRTDSLDKLISCLNIFAINIR